jgi:hypothetical protein
MAIELSPIDEPAPAAPPVEADTAPPKRGRGRPAGSTNKPKVQQTPVAALPEPAVSEEPAQPEPPVEEEPVPPEPPVEEEPATIEQPTPIEQPVAEEPAPKKKRAARLPTLLPLPIPAVPIPVIPPIPERPRPEDLLRQMHLDARQRIGDSFTARRDAWTNQLNAKYKV